MKNINAFIFLCQLIYSPTMAQGDLSLLLGINTNHQDYSPVSGINLSAQYKIGDYEKMHYGIGLEYARFVFNVSSVYTSSTSILALNGFAEYCPFKIKHIEPYLKLEMGPAWCIAKGDVNLVIIRSHETSHFICAQFAPSIGSRFEIAKHFNIQLDIKRVVNYSGMFDEGGFNNYASVNFGVNITL